MIRSKPRVLFLAILLLGSAGPFASPAASQSAAPRPRPRVAVVLKNIGNPFFTVMEMAARDHQAARPEPYDLFVENTGSEEDWGRQKASVERLVAKKVHALVVAPVSSTALLDAFREAVDAGIAVVAIDSPLDEAGMAERGLAVPYVGPDNCAAARSVGESLAKRLAPGDAVAILEGDPAAVNARLRTAGFREAMEAAGMRVVAVRGAMWDTQKAYLLAMAMLEDHPGLAAFLCGNDLMAMGAVRAAADRGRAGEVRVAGFDNMPAVRPLLADGSVAATLDQRPGEMVVAGIETALRILDGETVPAFVETPVRRVVSESVGERSGD